MAVTSGEHYTATIEITRTVRAIPVAVGTPYERRVQPEQGTVIRDVSDVARLVIRGDSLDDLRGKIAAHAALL